MAVVANLGSVSVTIYAAICSTNPVGLIRGLTEHTMLVAHKSSRWVSEITFASAQIDVAGSQHVRPISRHRYLIVYVVCVTANVRRHLFTLKRLCVHPNPRINVNYTINTTASRPMCLINHLRCSNDTVKFIFLL